jgi:hypothetical protein
MHLLTGQDWNFLHGDELTHKELGEAWLELRDELMAEHIAQDPCSRPWAWWAFESNEPRRRVGPGPEPASEELYFGIPRLHMGWPPDGMYETEAAYLERLGLLTPGEQKHF